MLEPLGADLPFDERISAVEHVVPLLASPQTLHDEAPTSIWSMLATVGGTAAPAETGATSIAIELVVEAVLESLTVAVRLIVCPA